MQPTGPNNQQPGGPAQAPPPTPVQPQTNPVAQVPQAAAPKPVTPAPNPSVQPTASPPTIPPPPPKKGFPIKIVVIIAIVFILIFAGIFAVILLSGGQPEEQVVDNQVFAPSPTPEVGPREHTAEDYSEFNGVPIDEGTVAFNKVDESFRIRYFDQIYHEQDSGSFQPREVFPETADDFDWYGLVDTPDDVVGQPQLFSFKAPPTYRSFVFIMRWDDEAGEKFEMYRFHDNQVTKLEEFRKDRSFYVPVLDNFSLGGNFVSINIFSCTTCFDEEPEILLYHIPSGESRNIGRVSYFAWGDDDNAYEYKEYKEGVDPDKVPLRKNEFFVESTNILNPNN